MDTKNKTRVLIFSVTYFPFVGGAEVALHEITQRIPRLQFDLITAKLSQDLPASEQSDNLYIYRVGRGSKLDKYLYPLRAYLFARKLHAEHKYTLIWAMLATWAGMAALLFKVFNPRLKYLLTLQSGDSDLFIHLRTWFWYPIYRLIYARADHLQVISSWLKKRARRYGYKKEISLVPNGVNLEQFRSSRQAKQLKTALNIPASAKIILTTSRLVAKNDIQSLIRAFHLLTSNYSSPIYLLIVGSGKLSDKLKNLAQQLKLSGKVVFAGHTERSEIFNYYAAADIFVRPSLSEGQGVSFIEAMAAGLPVIATPVGGIPDFLLDKKTGLFCQPKNPHDLAQKMNLLLTDRDLYSQIQDNALKLVNQKYSWDLIAAQMDKIFTKFI